MYNLLERYEYVFARAALPLYPWIALPVRDMRDGVIAVRATTLRDVVRAVVPRDTTFRAVLFARDTVFVVVARDTTPRDRLVVPATRPVADVVRATVAFDTPRFVVRPDARFVAFVRGDAFDCTGVIAGAIGSANTARIDKNVEHTKNAPAKRNTVPTAFFATNAISRLFIHYSPADAKSMNPPFLACQTGHTTIVVRLYYNIFSAICKEQSSKCNMENTEKIFFFRHTGGCRYPVANGDLLTTKQVCFRKLDPAILRDDEFLELLYNKKCPEGHFLFCFEQAFK